MKKINTFGLGSFTFLLILVVMGIPLWVYFFGDGSLPSIKYMFFSLILFGVVLLVIISNMNQVVEFYNTLVEVDSKSKQSEGEDIYNQSEEKEKKIKEEHIEEFHNNGYLKLVGTYLDGIRDGEWKFYDEKGDLSITGKYKKGKRDGVWVEYHKGGEKIHFKQSYQDDKIIDTTFESYHETGEIETRGYYQDGKKHGEWISWYRNGKVRLSGKYKNGKESGRFYLNNLDGSGREVFFDSPVDFTYEHYRNQEKGIMIEEGIISYGKRHGDWKTYDEFGKLKKVETLKYGIKKVSRFYSEKDTFDWTGKIRSNFNFYDTDDPWFERRLS
jgi:antitoxin component YwqK of YwqJK toxin-antitoxin module